MGAVLDSACHHEMYSTETVCSTETRPARVVCFVSVNVKPDFCVYYARKAFRHIRMPGVLCCWRARATGIRLVLHILFVCTIVYAYPLIERVCHIQSDSNNIGETTPNNICRAHKNTTLA